LDAGQPGVTINPGAKNPLKTTLQNDASRACSTWAIKDLDCPTRGCLGFSFTLPDQSKFKADATLTNPSPHRPGPVIFPMQQGDIATQSLPNWLVKFAGTTLAPDNSNGFCRYTKLPSYLPTASNECDTPDWVPK